MKKLIRLKPLTPFFFGTNKTFSDDTLHDVTSSLFPQQTHILGMLRFFILQSHGLVALRRRGRWVKNNNFQKAFRLVGGFDKNDKNQKEESFGIVNTISPVFITSTNNNAVTDFHFIAPKDTGLEITKHNTDDIIQIANKNRTKIYTISNYNPKIGTVEALTTSAFWEAYQKNGIPLRAYETEINEKYLENLNLLPLYEVFRDVTQVGIKRNKKTRTVQADDEGSFYHKTSYSFADEKYEFAFIVDLNEDLPEHEGFVYLGAERSSFRIKIEDYDENIQKYYPQAHHNDTKAIALGDIAIKDFNNIAYMVNQDYIAHAFMERTKEKQHRASSKYSKSQQQHYIPRGSVIYFKDDFHTGLLNDRFNFNSLLTKGETA